MSSDISGTAGLSERGHAASNRGDRSSKRSMLSDSLCSGFSHCVHSRQLVDQSHCKPLDLELKFRASQRTQCTVEIVTKLRRTRVEYLQINCGVTSSIRRDSAAVWESFDKPNHWHVKFAPQSSKSNFDWKDRANVTTLAPAMQSLHSKSSPWTWAESIRAN